MASARSVDIALWPIGGLRYIIMNTFVFIWLALSLLASAWAGAQHHDGRHAGKSALGHDKRCKASGPGLVDTDCMTQLMTGKEAPSWIMCILLSCTQGVHVSQALDGYTHLENIKCAIVIIARALQCALNGAHPSGLHECRVVPVTELSGVDDQGMSAHPLTHTPSSLQDSRKSFGLSSARHGQLHTVDGPCQVCE